MDIQKLRELIQQKEGLKLDFKREWKSIDKSDLGQRNKDELIRDILSLLNGNIGTADKTGYLIFGVDDNTKTKELYDVGKINLKSHDILKILNSACEPPLHNIDCGLVELDGKNLFVISIPPSPYLHTTSRDLILPNKKNFPENTTFIRRNEDIFTISEPEREAIKKEKSQIFIPSYDNNNELQILFSTEINNFREGFIGRKHIFDEIDDFIGNESKGYFIIEGEPGIGKSAIIAQYSYKSTCIVYFNRRSKYNLAHQFLENICKQIISRYQLNLSITTEETFNGGFLFKLLEKVSKKNQKLVIAIDALDEVDSKDQISKGINILYLPESLPDGIYFLLSQRNSTPTVSACPNTPLKKIDLKEYFEENSKDISLYLESEIHQNTKLLDKIKLNGWSNNDFITTLTDKSKGNFMYVRYILEGIKSGKYKNTALDKLPDGLSGYYEKHWNRMGMNDDVNQEDKLSILRILVDIRQPISISLIAKWSNKLKKIARKIINQWGEFLQISKVANEQYCFIYHTSFRDFLFQKDDIQETDILIPGVLTNIEDIFIEVFNQNSQVIETEEKEYLLEYLPSHLADYAEQKDKLYKLLSNFKFIKEKILLLRLQLIIEDYNLISKPSLSNNPEILEQLRLVQSALKLSFNTLSQDISQLPGQLLGRLQFSDAPLVRQIIDQALLSTNYSWLKPISSSLTIPGESLLFNLKGHNSPIRTVLLYSHEQRAISASNNGNIIIWDLVNGTILNTLYGHSDIINTLAITSDEKLLVSGSDDCSLKIWDLATCNNVYTLEGHDGEVRAASINSAAQIIISASDDNTLKIWNLLNGECLKTLYGHEDAVKILALTVNGEEIISASDDYTLKIWQLESGINIHTLQGHTDKIKSIVLIRNTNQLISASDDRTLRIWDLNSGECLSILEGHTDWVTAVAVTSDGTKAASVSNDKDLRIWDLNKGVCTSVLEECHDDWINSVEISCDDKLVITTSNDKTLKIWNLEDLQDLEGKEQPKAFKEHTRAINTSVITSDGKHIISASEDGTLKLWNLGAKNTTTEDRHNGEVNALIVGCNNRLVTSAYNDKNIKIWNIDKGKNVFNLPHSDGVSTIAITRDFSKIISAYGDGVLKVWDVNGNRELAEFKSLHKESVNLIALLDDEQHVISASIDKTLKLWDINTGNVVHTFQDNEEYETNDNRKYSIPVNFVAVINENKNLISASEDGRLLVWNLCNGKLEKCILAHDKNIINLKVLPGNKIISTSEDKTIKIWDTSNYSLIYSFNEHRDIVKDIVTTNNYKYAISGSYDKTLKVWDLQNGNIVRSIDSHDNIIHDICITSDDKYLISASEDNNLKVWDWQKGECITTFTADSEITVCEVTYNEGNIVVIAAEKSGRVHFLQLKF